MGRRLRSKMALGNTGCRRYRPRRVSVTGSTCLTTSSGSESAPSSAREVFTTALRAIETNYVVPVESERLVYSAITGMLQTLDPHSSFMDPKSYAQMRERQEGRYYGLGITITVVDGDITGASLAAQHVDIVNENFAREYAKMPEYVLKRIGEIDHTLANEVIVGKPAGDKN